MFANLEITDSAAVSMESRRWGRPKCDNPRSLMPRAVYAISWAAAAAVTCAVRLSYLAVVYTEPVPTPPMLQSRASGATSGGRPGRLQWRRQTMKSGSAFKGQLYFQVGQMEGPTVPSDSREAQSAEWGRLGQERRGPSRLGGLWAMPQQNFKFQKNQL